MYYICEPTKFSKYSVYCTIKASVGMVYVAVKLVDRTIKMPRYRISFTHEISDPFLGLLHKVYHFGGLCVCNIISLYWYPYRGSQVHLHRRLTISKLHVSLTVNVFVAVAFMLCCFFCFKLLLPFVVNKDDYYIQACKNHDFVIGKISYNFISIIPITVLLS